MNRKFFIKIIGALIFLSMPMVIWTQENSANQYDALLNQADKNKGGSKQVFDLSLEQLQQQRGQLSTEQQEYLDYLLIFNLMYDGQYAEAAKAFESLFTRAKSTFVKVRVQSSLSNLYAFNREYRSVFRALQYVTNALPDIRDKDLKHTIYLATANSYLLTDRYQLAREFSNVLLKDEPEPFKRCRAMSYRQLAEIELQNTAAIHDVVFNEIFDLCISQKQYIVADLLALQWYEYQFKQLNDDFTGAEIERLISAVEKTCLNIDTQQFKSIVTGKDALLAQLHLANNDLTLAEDYAQKVLKDAAQLGESKHKQKAYQVLEAIAKLQNNTTLAYEYLRKHSGIESVLMKDKLDKQVAFAAVQHDVLAKELQLEQINKSNELLQTQAQLNAQNSLNQKLMLAWLVLAVSLLVYWVYRASKKRKELEILVELDHMTKILNRKGLEAHINQLITRKAAQRQTVHLAIMDLDLFKAVNDEFGHLVGDSVLKHVVYSLKNILDKNMILGRLGGEEFAIVACDVSNNEMYRRLEAMRKMVEKLDFSECEHPISLTASFGYASTETAGYSLQMLLTQADVALYDAKNSGRNQTIGYRSPDED